MSEQKSPLVSVVGGAVGVMVLLFGGFFLMGMLTQQLNPKATKKLLYQFKCENAYKMLKKDGAKGWGEAYMTVANQKQADCMAGKPMKPPVTRKATPTKTAPTKGLTKTPANKAPDKPKQEAKGILQKMPDKPKKPKKLTPKQLKAKCEAVQHAAFVGACMKDYKPVP